MNRSRLQIAKADIVSHFDSLPTQVFKLKEIRAIVSAQRAFWRLAQNTAVEQVVDFLIEHSKLKFLEFPFRSAPRHAMSGATYLYSPSC